jgi:hypothetical protein
MCPAMKNEDEDDDFDDSAVQNSFPTGTNE